jgi:hypothetical protein
MPNDQTLQITFPEDEAAAYKQMARAADMSVSAFLRTRLAARSEPRFLAWVVPSPGMADARAQLARMREQGEQLKAHQTAHYVLERFSDDLASGSSEFLVFDAGNRPLTTEGFRGIYHDVLLPSGGGLVTLKGWAQLYRLVRSGENVKANQLLWLLAPVH